MDKLQIVKIGGTVLENEVSRRNFLSVFASLKQPKILIHGGGKSATALAEKMSVPVQMKAGRRITDTAMLEIALMTYGGKLNKTITAELQAMKTNAIGLSGADGNAVQAVKRPVSEIDYGWVGDVVQVNTQLFQHLCALDLVPVCCSLTHDRQGQLLNTNADTMASEIAIALSGVFEVQLIYCFEKQGVLLDIDDPSSLISELTASDFKSLQATGQIADGMIPKLTNCFHALEKGVDDIRIGPVAVLTENIPHTKIRL